MPDEVARHWSAVAGWVRCGAPSDPDLRGDAPATDEHPDILVLAELDRLRAEQSSALGELDAIDDGDQHV